MALKDKADLTADKNTAYPDNTSGDISEQDLRDQQQDIIDSNLNLDAGTPEQTIQGDVNFTGAVSVNGVPISSYVKRHVSTSTPSNNFNSNSPVNVPDLTYTIGSGEDGDYVIYGIVNGVADKNEAMAIFVAKNGTFEPESMASLRFQKKEDESTQITFPLDGLVETDVITIQMETNGEDIDIGVRQLLLQKW